MGEYPRSEGEPFSFTQFTDEPKESERDIWSSSLTREEVGEPTGATPEQMEQLIEFILTAPASTTEFTKKDFEGWGQGHDGPTRLKSYPQWTNENFVTVLQEVERRKK
jgi:hypothetical protein